MTTTTAATAAAATNPVPSAVTATSRRFAGLRGGGFQGRAGLDIVGVGASTVIAVVDASPLLAGPAARDARRRAVAFFGADVDVI
jgi:hypothetical protein